MLKFQRHFTDDTFVNDEDLTLNISAFRGIFISYAEKPLPLTAVDNIFVSEAHTVSLGAFTNIFVSPTQLSIPITSTP